VNPASRRMSMLVRVRTVETSKEVVLVAVAQDGRALEYASEELRADKEVVLAAVAQDGRALRYASEGLTSDKEVVLAAVAQDGRALHYASDVLRQQYGRRRAEFLANARRAEGDDSADVVEVAAPARIVETIVLNSDDDEAAAADDQPPPVQPRKRRRAEPEPAAQAAAAQPTQPPPPPPRQPAAPPTATPVKVERDGGWPGEFQELRRRPFDAAEHERLTQFFLAPGGRAVPRGGRVTRSRQDETARLAEWPRLNQAVRAMHASGQWEEALGHLRCFVDGEEVDLVDESDEEGDGLGVIDVEALESLLIGGADSVGAVAANSSVAGQMDGAIKRIKRELTR
jgi:hypothetical protein